MNSHIRFLRTRKAWLVPLLPLLSPAVAARADGYAFEDTAVDGQTVTVAAADGHITVVCFLGTECPLARLYGPRLSAMAHELQSSGVRFVGINSNSQDSADEIRAFARDSKIAFPIIRDGSHRLADLFDAQRTPEVLVLDQRLQLQYRGRIDDQYEPGISRAEPTQSHLRAAIDDLLAGRPVAISHTEPVGCRIGRTRAEGANPRGITYAKDISRVLQAHCLECHRDGEIGPFSMERFDDVAAWSETIAEVIDNGRMPPWHADSRHGQFANARSMPEHDKQLIRDWIAAGTPFGDARDLPPTVTWPPGWQLPREPDAVFTMRERPFAVPAEGTVEYQYFVVDPKLTEDKWIAAAQVVPGNRSVVHHAIVFVRPPDGGAFRGVGWLSAYVPGQRALSLPPGRARRVQAGSKLVFQMHYTPNGVPASDTTRIGIVYAEPAEVTHEVYTLVGIDQEFEIPPGAKGYTVEAEVPRLPDRGELLAITPHMHYRGQTFRLWTGRQADQLLLHVPRYDFNWQHTYQLTTPLPLAEVSRLRFAATFDNSADNPFNPDPTARVHWGDQTWEEMAVAFFDVSEPIQDPAARATANTTDKSAGSMQARSRERTEKYVDRVFATMDADHDGVIREREASIVFRIRQFHRFDQNGDKAITRREVRSVARSLLGDH